MRLFAITTALILSIGCRPAAGVLIDDETIDDGVTDPTDDGTTDPTDDGTTDPNDTDPADTEPPEPEIATWEGEREFEFGGEWGDWGCEDTLTETGVEVTGDPSFANAVDACPICDHVFEVDVAEEALCPGEFDWYEDGIPVAQHVFRGLAIGNGGNVIMYSITEDDDGAWHREELAEGELVGVELEYWYGGTIYGAPYEVLGGATLHDLKP